MQRLMLISLLCCLMMACGGKQASKSVPASKNQTPSSTSSEKSGSHGVKSNPNQSAGGYYLDDGPDANPPSNLDEIPDAAPRHEPLNPNKNKPYQALGETYIPIASNQSFSQRGVASWYGKRFHGKKTAIGEKYDMYAMTAAHPTLPLPSYVKVVNPANDRSVIVRVNDRGPFKSSRIIDLSYAAAHRLRIVERGSALVHIETVDVDSYHAEKNKTSNHAVDGTAAKHTSSPTETTYPILQFFVQVGAFQLEDNLHQLKLKIQNLGIAQPSNINHVYNSNLHRLKLGPYHSKDQASLVADEIRKKLNISSIIKHQ